METVMGRKTAEETARAAKEMYAARNDPDLLTGEVVTLEPSTDPASVVLSVRLNGADLGEIERAAAAAGMKLSTYVKHAALTAARDSSRISRAEVLEQIDAMGERLENAIAQIKQSVAAGANKPATRPIRHEAG
jgi:uncharacterized protein (DUF1778 family)